MVLASVNVSPSCYLRHMSRRAPTAQRALNWNYNWIVPGKIIQGGYPNPPSGALAICDTLVLTAQEAQPRIAAPSGKLVLKLPLDDDFYRPVPREVGQMAIQVAAQLADEVRAGRRVAITCWEGVNRSGLLTALTMIQLFRCSPQQAISTIRANRKHPDRIALGNPMFEQFLLTLR